MNQSIIEYLKKEEIKFCQNGQIRHHTSIKIGGKADLLVTTPSYDTLTRTLVCLEKSKQPFVLLGGGSNVVFTDESCEFVVILNRSNNILKLDDTTIQVDSGTPNSHLMKWCAENGVGGLEFLAGIPGTIGGAAAVNAGAFGRSMEEVIDRGEIYIQGQGIQWLDNSFFNFSYRESNIKYSSHSILRLTLRYKNAPTEDIIKKVRENIQYRHTNHPAYHRFTAGCFFKNPQLAGEKVSAGGLLDQLGYKGFVHNELLLSNQHANFLINKGNATFEDVAHLEKMIKDAVAQAKNIQLQREVIYVSHRGEKY